jgi:hypothetical protein
MELTQESVERRLQELAKQDKSLKVFGAGMHEYQLNPPLELQVVESFERQHRISLPDDYKRFITEIDNGGAGPFYGLFPFGEDESGPWKPGELVGDVGKPFPHSKAWNADESLWSQRPVITGETPEAEEDRLYEEWDRVLEQECWSPHLVNGTIPIADRGCALREWLVIHGGQRGFVWTDYRADEVGLFPLKNSRGQQMTFSDWYSFWLDNLRMPMPKVRDQ